MRVKKMSKKMLIEVLVASEERALIENSEEIDDLRNRLSVVTELTDTRLVDGRRGPRGKQSITLIVDVRHGVRPSEIPVFPSREIIEGVLSERAMIQSVDVGQIGLEKMLDNRLVVFAVQWTRRGEKERRRNERDQTFVLFDQRTKKNITRELK